MTHLTSVEVWYDSELQVFFSTSLDLAETCDTAVLQLVHGGGSELGIRIERGRITDVYVWDPVQLIRQRLPEAKVVLERSGVSCSIPLRVLPSGAQGHSVKATLIVNGAPVQTGFPVTLRRRAAQPSRNSVGAAHS